MFKWFKDIKNLKQEIKLLEINLEYLIEVCKDLKKENQALKKVKTTKIENVDVKIKIIKLKKENKALKNKFKRKSKLPRGLVTGIPKKKSRRTK